MSDTAPPSSARLPLEGLRIVCFESRRSAETARLIARQGGLPIEAPALREVPLRGAEGLDALEQDLGRGSAVLLVLLTGVGAELMIEGLSQTSSKARAIELLSASTTTIVCRGPKPYAALKAVGIKPALVVGEPNTWRDVLREVDAAALAAGQSVYVQEYGRSNAELLDGLSQRGAASVRQIKTYAWELPEDLAPLHLAIERVASGDAEVVLFTSGVQLTHLLRVAAQQGATERLTAGMKRLLIASVGPVTTEALVAAGFVPDIEPEHPKLGHLVAALAAGARQKLLKKRGA